MPFAGIVVYVLHAVLIAHRKHPQLSINETEPMHIWWVFLVISKPIPPRLCWLLVRPPLARWGRHKSPNPVGCLCSPYSSKAGCCCTPFAGVKTACMFRHNFVCVHSSCLALTDGHSSEQTCGCACLTSSASRSRSSRRVCKSSKWLSARSPTELIRVGSGQPISEHTSQFPPPITSVELWQAGHFVAIRLLTIASFLTTSTPAH